MSSNALSLRLAGAAFLLLASAPVAASNDANRTVNGETVAAESAPVTTPAAKPAKEKKICRTEEADTGSRMGARKVCLTAEQWSRRGR